jgi:Trypsin-co-occurring domain 1
MAGRAVVMHMGGMDLLVETMPVTGTEQTSERLEGPGSGRRCVRPGAVGHHGGGGVDGADDRQLGSRSVHPDEMHVTSGLKFSAQGNVIVADAAGEATLEVTLTYAMLAMGRGR